MKRTPPFPKIIWIFALLILSLLAASQVTGCASPLETSYTTRSVFNSTVQDLTAARQANVIDAKSFAADIAVADSLVPALDALDAASTGDTINYWTIYNSVRPKLHDLTTKAILAKKGGK